MTLRLTVLLALLGLAASLLVARLQSSPGYMDAEYYYQGGLRLAGGYGFSDPFLWNYLDKPTGLPHPSHTYWMPLASILSAAGMWLSGNPTFAGARLGSLFLAACVSPVTAWLAFSFAGKRWEAVFAGLLAVASGFYLPFLATTDTFGVYMVLGALWFLTSRAASGWKAALILGVLSGLFQLARADGIIWLGATILVVLAGWLRQPENGSAVGIVPSRLNSFPHRLPDLGVALAGYLAIAGPWLVRNWITSGALFSPGSEHAFWITTYNDLYAYPADILTASRWWSHGISAILQGRLWAAGQNIQTWLAVQSGIFLAPLILIGLWMLRKEKQIVLACLVWLVTFGLMTLVFPYQGARGGFFHSGAAFQPLFWAVAPVGLASIVEWGARVRHWHPSQARAFLGSGVLVLAALLSIWLVNKKVVGDDPSNPVWNQSASRYARIEQGLQSVGAGSGDIVLVNNPPGYYTISGRPAIPIPYGDLNMLLAAASRYHARYLLLEFDQLGGSEDLYDLPGDRPGLHYLSTIENTRIYQVVDS